MLRFARFALIITQQVVIIAMAVYGVETLAPHLNAAERIQLLVVSAIFVLLSVAVNSYICWDLCRQTSN